MANGINAVYKALRKANLTNIEAQEWRKSVILSGKVSKWEDKIKAGYLATHKGYKGIVNDIEVEGIKPETMSLPKIKDNALDGKHFDVAIIGGGIIGCSLLRELSRYDIKAILLDKEEDVAKHASSRNDGMIHPGFAASPGSKKAYYNVRGNRAYTQVCKELGVDFKRVGSLIIFTHPFSKLLTPILVHRAKKNDVDGYEYISRGRLRKLEPNISSAQHGAFFLPSAGILSPYRLTIAYVENAVENGAKVSLNTAVLGFDMDKNHISTIKTNRGILRADVVVNASGIWSDVVAGYGNDRFFSLHPRKGVDAILDIKTGKHQTRIGALVKFSQMKSKTKGGGVVPAIEGNLLIGPTADEVPYREDYSTDAKSMKRLQMIMRANTKIKNSDIITYFAGTRACTYEEDFVIEPSENIDNFVHVAGIQSPGLASAPAIAEDVSKMCINILKQKKDVKTNQNFDPYRKTSPELNMLSLEERAKLIKKNPTYGRVVCRCEAVSEGEVRDALKSTIPACTLDGIKRRTRAGAGRCHGGFCTPRVMEIMSEETDTKITELNKKGEGSQMLLSETKGQIDYLNKKVKTMKSED